MRACHSAPQWHERMIATAARATSLLRAARATRTAAAAAAPWRGPVARRRAGHPAASRPRAARFAAVAMAQWEAVTFGATGAPGVETGAKDAPGVMLIQEWWGVNVEIKALGARLAEKGYRVLIPDIYNGKLALDAEEANHEMSNLDWPKALGEICDGVAYLHDTGSAKVGITGTCMGGALALAAAAKCGGLACAAPFYGTPDPGLADVSTITIPVQAHFGELDDLAGFSDKAAADGLRDALAANAEAEVFLYPGAGHGFMNAAPDKPRITPEVAAETGFPPANPEAQAAAWERVVSFFAKHLK